MFKFQAKFFNVIALFLVTATAQAEFLPKIKYFPSKLTDAWDNQDYSEDIHELPDGGSLVDESQNDQDVDYDRIASWYPFQIEYALRAHYHLLKTEFESKNGWFRNALGGVGILFGYDYKVEPTYYRGLYTRIDNYAMQPQLGIRSTIKKMDDYRAVMSLNPGFELEYGYFRQFESAKDAITARPYFHKNLPFDAKHALKGLNPGDVFRFRAKLDLNLDSSVLTDLVTLSAGVSAGFYFTASGKFEVYIIRLPENKVQLRVVGARSHRAGAQTKIGVEGIKIMDVKVVDNYLMSQVNLDMLSAKIEKRFNDGEVLDYIIDLNEADSVKAFDQALLKIREFNYMGLVNPSNSFEDFSKKLSLNFIPLEEERSKDDSGVKRLNHVKSNGSVWHVQGRLGNSLLGLSLTSHNSVNKMSAGEEGEKYYIFETKQRKEEYQFLYSLWREEYLHGTSLILDKDTDTPIGVAVTSEKIDKNLSAKEASLEIKRLKRQLPETTNLLELSHLEGKEMDSFALKTQVVFTPAALEALPEMRYFDILKRYSNYLSQFNMNDILFKLSSASRKDELESKTKRVVSYLNTLLKVGASLKEKAKTLMRLNEMRLFRETGIGFLLSLLPQDSWKDLVFVEIAITSTNNGGLVFSSGPEEGAKLNADLLHYENLMNQDDVNLRFLLESSF